MKYRSLKDWNKKGYKVLKNSKSSAITNDGEHLFSNKQVEKFHKSHQIEEVDYSEVSSSQEVEEYSMATTFMPAQCIGDD